MPVYYLTYIDPKTGFLKREETTNHQALVKRIQELVQQGVTIIGTGQYKLPSE
jgi:hypothetical protein